ncbi:MAG: hypothetical protein A2140_00900 [Candidatus Muproteobacteria bacterium RBG_16_62_13]|uniref:Zinc finger DksA/TraR C4-type domain-containing protein n=1 Tax=Candidatus Muproteobacteria bacterium RBG_16_62_13 TaxID=1817756 RepID=A0A1F6T817_9PROT|nr:MAG: hypothetical protein A2140_00900 [Candidatus Muproteobacteria bacterium RBG_16_62_13]
MATLSSKQLDMFRDILRTRRDALRQIVQAALANTERSDFVELAGQVRDVGDESTADLLAGMNLNQIEREIAELSEVEAALERLRLGNYGVCADCGDAVGIDRLRAWPTAKRCLPCQSRLETRRRGGKDPTPSL